MQRRSSRWPSGCRLRRYLACAACGVRSSAHRVRTGGAESASTGALSTTASAVRRHDLDAAASSGSRCALRPWVHGNARLPVVQTRPETTDSSSMVAAIPGTGLPALRVQLQDDFQATPVSMPPAAAVHGAQFTGCRVGLDLQVAPRRCCAPNSTSPDHQRPYFIARTCRSKRMTWRRSRTAAGRQLPVRSFDYGLDFGREFSNWARCASARCRARAHP